MKITWIGHSCFKIESNGFAIVTDPYSPGSVPGLRDLAETAQLVCCSHEHGDHAYRDGVKIVDAEGNAPEIERIQSWHDEVKGAKRGPNTIHIFDFAGKRVAHMGDIGCGLTDDQILAMKKVDVLLIPVGGYFTIEPDLAIDMVKRIEPRMVIPMHYRDEKLHFGYKVIGTVDKFLDAFGDDVLTGGTSIDTEDYSCADCTTVIRMTPQNAGC